MIRLQLAVLVAVRIRLVVLLVPATRLSFVVALTAGCMAVSLMA